MEYTDVYFKGIDHVFKVSQTLAEFTLFGHDFTIRWYGAIIAFGFILAALFGGRIAYTWKMDLDKMIDVLIYGTIGGIIGARLYYCVFEWEYYGKNPVEILKMWNGGLAIYGGLIGGLLAAYITCRVRKLNFFNLLDCAGMSFLIGQGIGRWGNFTNQEAFGTNTDLPWGMWSAKVQSYIIKNQASFIKQGISIEPGTVSNKAYVHPTFLYESLWCLLGVLILYIICRKYRKFSGQIILCYGVWYGAERAFVEGLRTDSLYLGPVRVSQLLSVLIVVACAVLLAVKLVKYTKNPKPIEGVDFYFDGDSVISLHAESTSPEASADEWDNNAAVESHAKDDTHNDEKTDGDKNI
ncbi:MAG: prolipoprotein diacylglyceryl transferase [Clostridiales bacterium]|jgi:phosphatidylglycerol:prolipoprotein diacylglycerol transferase|nr:prolipoprotein diacylglyceryl transferase [Clostridiales bacterium]